MIEISEQLHVLATVAYATILGAMIGFEREKADKPAGTRTQALVAGAAALIVATGAVVGSLSEFGDPTRSMHAVVTGIGFLGGSVILASKRGVQGVTTAATVFTTAAIGASVGLGFHITAFGFVIIVVTVLRTGQVFNRMRKNDSNA